MEPLAPGTEDDTESSQIPTSSKKASEQQRLLSLKAYLPNRSYGRIFELSFPNGAEHWYCHLCECPVMGRVYHHEIGKRHTSRLQMGLKWQQGSTPLVEEEADLRVAPGEPVPPGFEGKVQKVAEIQDRLDNYHAGALLGLEYLLEIQEYDTDKEPSYLCLLCYKKGDPRTVIAHLGSYNHLCQFLQRHFPTCYRALSPYMTKQYKRNWQIAVTKIAEAIEAKYGRLKPFPVEKDTFEEKKQHYWDLINNGQHFSEKQGPSFEELIDKEQLTKNLEGAFSQYDNPKRSPSPPVVAKPTKNKKPASAVKKTRSQSLSSVSTISSSDLSDFEPDPKKRNVEYNYRSRNRHVRYRSRSRSRSRSPYRPNRVEYKPKPKDNLLPWQRSDYLRNRSDVQVDSRKQRNDKYEEYKKLANAIETDMEKTLKMYERNPEKHPQYNDEWKVFWNKRYKELQNEGKDPNTFDFKPEWIQYWNKRILELHNAEVKNRKEALRKRLGLPEEPAPICFRITGKRKPGFKEDAPHKPVPVASQPDQDHEVIVIEDKDDDTKSSKRSHSPWESDSGRKSGARKSREKSRDRDRDRDRDRSRDRSRDSSWEKYSPDYRKEREYRKDYKGSKERNVRNFPPELLHDRDLRFAYKKDFLDCYKPPPVMRDVTRQPVYPTHMPRPPPKEEVVEDDGEINIVGVLRLLTALEEKLGSLGPKVIDLLAQALALEKNTANSSETLLDNEINCVLFETVKEKLKGQLLAELVDYVQEKAFKNAIKKIASLLHFANQRKKEAEVAASKPDPVKVPGVGAVDKAAIAKQIATALIMQGKTDVTQSELEQLINAVVGMAEAQQHSDKPITTADFIEKMQNSEPIPIPKPSPTVTTTTPLQALQNSSSDANSMNGLSDSDLQTLLQNFKDLSNEEQHSLINYLKKLESKEPERVEQLRKFVNIGSEAPKEEEKKSSGRISPFASKLANAAEDMFDDFEEEFLEKKEEPVCAKVALVDSEDEDYSYDDVCQAATTNVKQKEEEIRKQEELLKKDTDLVNAKTLIANLMSNISSKGSHLSESAQLTQTLNDLPVNMENIAEIVGNIQHLNPENAKRKADGATHLNLMNSPNPSASNFNNNFRPAPNQPANSNNLIRYPNLQSYPQNVRPEMNLSNPQQLPYNRNNYNNVSYPTPTSSYSFRPQQQQPPQQQQQQQFQPDRSQNFYDSKYRGNFKRGGFNNANIRNNFDWQM